MGQMYLNDQGSIRDEKAMPLASNNDEGLEEEDHLSVNTSEIKMDSKKRSSKHPLILDKKQQNSNNSSNKLTTTCTITDCISFLGSTTNISQHTFGLVDHIAPNFLCRTTSLINIIIDQSLSEFFVINLKYRADCVEQFTSVTQRRNFFINSSSGQLVFGSVENTKTFLESPISFRLATIDNTMSRISTRIFNTGEMKSSKLANSPARLPITSSHDHPTVVACPENERLNSKVSGEMHVSCPSTISSCSYQSTSIVDSPVCKGQLRFMWKSGNPYFVFTTGDDQNVIYVANLSKTVSSVDKSVDHIYLFHSRKKEFRNYSNFTMDFVGKMKVSNSLILDPNWSKVLETEFVLFGADGDHSKEMQSSASNGMKNRGLSKKLADIFRPSYSFKHKSRSQNDNFLPGLGEFEESGLVSHLENDFPHYLQLAAIIISDHRHDSNEKTAVGGWGLKFLEKITSNHHDASFEASIPSHSGEGFHRGRKNMSARSLNVLVPAGFHGGPTTKGGGTSSLTERWRSGGHCDCGGWDIGCPLTVLNDKSNVSDDPFEVSQEECKSISLFIEGTKHDKPTFEMVNVDEGVYSMYFQSSTLSALLAFSIGVAIIHTRTPDLNPKL